LITALRRDLKTVGSFSGNNLFIVAIAFLFLGDPGVVGALFAFIGLVLFIPLSADPLRVLPRDRLAVWPLSMIERRLLRILTPWLNPVTWLIMVLAAKRRVSVSLSAVVVGVFLIGFVLPSFAPARSGAWRRLPTFPGPLNHLIRKNLRETLSTLDFWSGAIASAFSIAFRATGLLPPEALLPMTILVMLAISTHAQTLFGLDGDGGMARYRLLPVPGWQILAAKDVPFLLASMVMTLPLAPAAGLGAALTALANRPSYLRDPPRQTGALAVLQRSVLRYGRCSSGRDVFGSRSGPCDSAPGSALRGRVCVLHLVERTVSGATAAVASVHLDSTELNWPRVTLGLYLDGVGATWQTLPLQGRAAIGKSAATSRPVASNVASFPPLEVRK
jgi:hypothetical protein